MFTRKEQLSCKYCPTTTRLVEDLQAGDLVCTGCGLVCGDRIIDVGAEWRTFSNDTLLSKSRVGAEENVLYDGIDLSTMIGQTGASSVAYDEGGERKYRNKKFLSSTQRTLVSGFREIAEMAEKLNTTRPVIECGQLIFKNIQSKHALKGRSNESIAAACLYVAYRKNNVPRTFKEICAVARATKKDIGKCYKVISKVIGEVIHQPTLADYIPRFSAHLGLPTPVENRARKLLDRFDSLGVLAGRAPATIVALAILLAADLVGDFEQATSEGKSEEPQQPTTTKGLTTIRHISNVTGAAETTIREAYQILKSRAADSFPEYFSEEKMNNSSIKKGGKKKRKTVTATEEATSAIDPGGAEDQVKKSVN